MRIGRFHFVRVIREMSSRITSRPFHHFFPFSNSHFFIIFFVVVIFKRRNATGFDAEGARIRGARKSKIEAPARGTCREKWLSDFERLGFPPPPRLIPFSFARSDWGIKAECVCRVYLSFPLKDTRIRTRPRAITCTAPIKNTVPIYICI